MDASTQPTMPAHTDLDRAFYQQLKDHVKCTEKVRPSPVRCAFYASALDALGLAALVGMNAELHSKVMGAVK